MEEGSEDSHCVKAAVSKLNFNSGQQETVALSKGDSLSRSDPPGFPSVRLPTVPPEVDEFSDLAQLIADELKRAIPSIGLDAICLGRACDIQTYAFGSSVNGFARVPATDGKKRSDIDIGIQLGGDRFVEWSSEQTRSFLKGVHGALQEQLLLRKQLVVMGEEPKDSDLVTSARVPILKLNVEVEVHGKENLNRIQDKFSTKMVVDVDVALHTTAEMQKVKRHTAFFHRLSGEVLSVRQKMTQKSTSGDYDTKISIRDLYLAVSDALDTLGLKGNGRNPDGSKKITPSGKSIEMTSLCWQFFLVHFLDLKKCIQVNRNANGFIDVKPGTHDYNCEISSLSADLTALQAVVNDFFLYLLEIVSGDSRTLLSSSRNVEYGNVTEFQFNFRLARLEIVDLLSQRDDRDAMTDELLFESRWIWLSEEEIENIRRLLAEKVPNWHNEAGETQLLPTGTLPSLFTTALGLEACEVGVAKGEFKNRCDGEASGNPILTGTPNIAQRPHNCDDGVIVINESYGVPSCRTRFCARFRQMWRHVRFGRNACEGSHTPILFQQP